MFPDFLGVIIETKVLSTRCFKAKPDVGNDDTSQLICVANPTL